MQFTIHDYAPRADMIRDLHILILPSWYPAERNDVRGTFFRDQVHALSAAGCHVGVVAPNFLSLRRLRTWGRLRSGPAFESDQGVPTYRAHVLAALPRVPYGNYLLWRRATRVLLAKYFREHGRPDIIHAHCAIYAGVVAAEFGREHGIPVVLTEHSSGFARGSYRPWQIRLAKRACAGAAARIVVSPDLGRLLSKKLPVAHGEWQWIPNVIGSRFAYKQLGAARDAVHQIRYLNLALMTENKGQADLLEAFARMRTVERQDCELWLAGDGPVRPALEAEARALGIEGCVRFLGRVGPDQVPKLLGQVDVMVVSSHYETFGVAAAEALIAGVPVVATRCGGPECIVGEGDGELVPVKAPEALGHAMARVAGRLASMDRDAIAERARARFSPEAVASQLMDVYARVLMERTSLAPAAR